MTLMIPQSAAGAGLIQATPYRFSEVPHLELHGSVPWALCQDVPSLSGLLPSSCAHLRDTLGRQVSGLAMKPPVITSCSCPFPVDE